MNRSLELQRTENFRELTESELTRLRDLEVLGPKKGVSLQDWVRVRELSILAFNMLARTLIEGSGSIYKVQWRKSRKTVKSAAKKWNVEQYSTAWFSSKNPNERDTIVKQFTRDGTTIACLIFWNHGHMKPVQFIEVSFCKEISDLTAHERLKNMVFMVTDCFMSMLQQEAKYLANARGLISKIKGDL